MNSKVIKSSNIEQMWYVEIILKKSKKIFKSDLLDLGKYINYKTIYINNKKEIKQSIETLNFQNLEKIIIYIEINIDINIKVISEIIDFITSNYPKLEIVYDYEFKEDIHDNIIIRLFNSAETFIFENIVFNKNCNQLILIDYIGSDKEFTIPDKINDLSIYNLDFYAFVGTSIEKLIINQNITDFSDNHSLGLTNIKEIVLNNQMVFMGIFTFEMSKILERLKLPEGLVRIRHNTMRYLTNLKYIVFPNSLEELHHDALFHANNIRYLDLPNNLKLIEEGGLPFKGQKVGTLIIRSKYLLIDDNILREAVGMDIYLDKDTIIKVVKSFRLTSRFTRDSSNLLKDISEGLHRPTNTLIFKLPIDIVEIDGLRYLLFDDKTATIATYDQDKVKSVITIPDEINGYKVTRIGAKAFLGLRDVDQILTNDKIEIGYEAFKF